MIKDDVQRSVVRRIGQSGWAAAVWCFLGRWRQNVVEFFGVCRRNGHMSPSDFRQGVEEDVREYEAKQPPNTGISLGHFGELTSRYL